MFFAPLAAFASQRGHVRSAGDLEDRLFQIEGHGIEQELQFDFGQTEVSGSKEAVATLEGAEGAFHLWWLPLVGVRCSHQISHRLHPAR